MGLKMNGVGFVPRPPRPPSESSSTGVGGYASEAGKGGWVALEDGDGKGGWRGNCVTSDGRESLRLTIGQPPKAVEARKGDILTAGPSRRLSVAP